MNLCDGCFQAATGLHAVCQDGCCKPLDHEGLCLEPEPCQADCTWCGQADRLTAVDLENLDLATMPTVGEEDEGCWYLHWPSESQGPYASADAAWDAWHKTGELR